MTTEPQVQPTAPSVRGPLLRSADDGFEIARHIWNGMIDRRPSLIVQARGAADVIAPVNFAREPTGQLAVRGGGHRAAGSCVCDDELMLDLSLMKGIRVDLARRTVRAEAGLTWAEFDAETQAFGLATTGGVVS